MFRNTIVFTAILGLCISTAFAATNPTVTTSTSEHAQTNTSARLVQQKALLLKMEQREAMLKARHETRAAALEAKHILALKQAMARIKANTNASVSAGGTHIKTGTSSGAGVQLP